MNSADYQRYRKRAEECARQARKHSKEIVPYVVRAVLFCWRVASNGWHWVSDRTTTDRILAVSTVVIMLATIGGAVSTYLQWVELRSSSTQIDKSIAATNRIGDAAFTANQLNKDAYVANARAWIGPNDASLTNIVADGPVKGVINYTNTGRQPAPMNPGLSVKVYSKKQWADGTAARDVENGKSLCLRAPINDSMANVVFPTSGFSGFQLHIDTTPESIRDAGKAKITVGVISGEEILAITGCFIYRTLGATHHTPFCYFYEKSKIDPAHLGYCPFGQGAD